MVILLETTRCETFFTCFLALKQAQGILLALRRDNFCHVFIDNDGLDLSNFST